MDRSTAITVLPRPTASRWRFAVFFLLGLVIVAHGCHADRDTELRARPVMRRAG
jgi:hypothetical protein